MIGQRLTRGRMLKYFAKLLQCLIGIKTPEQQSVMMLHRVRLILNRQRTQLSNAMRAHLAEFRVVAPIGRNAMQA